jgi:hypothetical protein
MKYRYNVGEITSYGYLSASGNPVLCGGWGAGKCVDLGMPGSAHVLLLGCLASALKGLGKCVTFLQKAMLHLLWIVYLAVSAQCVPACQPGWC